MPPPAFRFTWYSGGALVVGVGVEISQVDVRQDRVHGPVNAPRAFVRIVGLVGAGGEVREQVEAQVLVRVFGVRVGRQAEVQQVLVPR
jgi:hypothetical protein